MKQSKKLKHDLTDLLNKFPKLDYSYDEKHRVTRVFGPLEICDKKGNYWNTFEILIKVGAGYPYEVPILKENSYIIPRNLERHITKEGECCVDIPHRLKLKAMRGIKLTNFIVEEVYPFFANQLYFDKLKKYANGEWGHNFYGIREFYREELQIEDDDTAFLFLKTIINGKIPGRNEICICGKQKLKNCHLRAVELLKSMDKERLKEDMEGFSDYKNK